MSVPDGLKSFMLTLWCFAASGFYFCDDFGKGRNISGSNVI